MGAGSGVAERDLKRRLQAAAQTVEQRESRSIEARVQAASAALDHNNHQQQQLSRGAELEIMAERDRGSAQQHVAAHRIQARVRGVQTRSDLVLAEVEMEAMRAEVPHSETVPSGRVNGLHQTGACGYNWPCAHQICR